MPVEPGELGAGLGAPDPNRPVMRPTDDASAVGCERHAQDPVPMPVEPGDLGAGLGVPDPHGLISRPADDASTVGGVGHAVDIAFMPTEDGTDRISQRDLRRSHRTNPYKSWCPLLLDLTPPLQECAQFRLVPLP